MLSEQVLVDARLVVEALEVRLGDELDEVLVAGEIADEDRQVVGALVPAVSGAALLAPARRDVELAAQDRLDPGLLSGEIEVDRAEQVAMVGERDRGKAQLLGLGHELVELRRA